MKKLIAVLLTMVFVLTMSIGVFAEEPVEKVVNPERQAQRNELKLIIDELKTLKEETLGLREQIKEKHEILKPLVKAVKESNDEEKIEATKATREQLKSIRTELESLRETREEIRLVIRSARESKDFDTVKESLATLLEQKEAFLSLINQKIVLLDELIIILQASSI